MLRQNEPDSCRIGLDIKVVSCGVKVDSAECPGAGTSTYCLGEESAVRTSRMGWICQRASTGTAPDSGITPVYTPTRQSMFQPWTSVYTCLETSP